MEANAHAADLQNEWIYHKRRQWPSSDKCIYAGGAVSKQDGLPIDIGMDIFERGLCLPSDNKMTVEQQDRNYRSN
mgnify:CR=1 FL=1